MGRPNLAQRLNAEKPCGCTAKRMCAQHWQLLSPADKKAWLRELGLIGSEHDDPRRA